MTLELSHARHTGALLAALLLAFGLGACSKKKQPVNRGNPPPAGKVLRVEMAPDTRAVQAMVRIENRSKEECRIVRFGLELAGGKVDWVTPKSLHVPAGGNLERPVRLRDAKSEEAARALRGVEVKVIARCGDSAR